jgi:peptidoglycan/LPS O-acetylase OafA/YrhL
VPHTFYSLSRVNPITTLANPANYRPDIDGLRALAILLVVIYHYFGVLGGYIGVDIFFVISGYLITFQIITSLDNQSFSLTDFYAKRVRRILPALAFVICSCLLFSWFFLFPTDFVLLAKHTTAGILNVSNIVLWLEAGYFDASSTHKPFLHLWSLGIEEQFYLVWPLLLMLFFRFRQHFLSCLVTLTVVSFVLNIIATHYDRTLAFYMPLTRFWELSAGGILAYAVVQKSGRIKSGSPITWPFGHPAAPWLGLVLILLATALLNQRSAFPGYWALLPVAGTCLMIAPTNRVTPGMGFLQSKTAVYFGKISFCIYLWHWPVLLLIHLIDFTSRPSKFVALGVCMLLSWFTCRFIEQPIRSIRVTRANARQFLWAGAAVSVAIAITGGLFATRTITRSWDDTLISKAYTVPQIGCGVFANEGKEFTPALFARCDKILYPESAKVMLLGDSHALSLYQGLKPYLDERHINLISYPVLECTPLSLRDQRPRCNDYNNWIREQINTLKPDLIIVFAHHLFRAKDPYLGEPAGYITHLWEQAAALKAQGVPNVWIIGGIPNWRESLPHAMNFNFLRRGQPVPEHTYTYVLEDSLKIDNLIREQDNHRGVEYISLKDALCNEQGCLTQVGNDFPEDLLVMDYGHLTQNGAKHISAQVLGEKIQAVLSHR